MAKGMDLIAELRSRGHRITQARTAIAEILAVNTKPLSALDVHGKLKGKKASINPTTVYRELQFLEKEGILKTVQLHDGVQRYELSSLPHHHHLVCTSCSRIEDVHMDHELHSIEETIKKTKKFRVERHSLEFYGTCGKCS